MIPPRKQSPTIFSGRPLALFLPDLAAGGGERITLTLGQALARRGLDVDLVVARARGPLLDELPQELNLVDLAQDRVRNALPALVRYLRVREPGWIMPTVDHANMIGAVAARSARTDTKVVLRPSTTLTQRVQGFGSPATQAAVALSRHCYRSADAVVACSQGMAADLARYCARDPRDIDVIPNATSAPDIVERSQQPLDHPWFAPGTPPVVLGVGRLAPPKDFPLLLEAFARVRRERHVRLVVLGDGPQRPDLEARAAALGIADDVALLGFESNPYRFMSRASVFALSSEREGLPGVLIEAMACGTSVVATDCPSGPSEILDGGRFGRLCPAGDPDALAQVITRALDEPLRAPPEALRRYEPATVATAYLDILERVERATHAA